MNIASALKQEISRVARKEVRAEVQSLKKASSQYRSDIAALKRRVMTLERLVGRLGRGKATASPVDTGEAPTALRFSAKGLAAQRKRLGLSAADAGRILGVSGASIYNWEDGTTRPRASQLPAIAQLRKMGKREAAARLAAAA